MMLLLSHQRSLRKGYLDTGMMQILEIFINDGCFCEKIINHKTLNTNNELFIRKWCARMQLKGKNENGVMLRIEPNFPYTLPIVYALWLAAKYPTK